MYRMLSPEREDADMGIATPRGTGGRSPPPPAAGNRLDRPPAAHLLAQASFGSWRSGQRRPQDQREWCRFARWRRGPRYCSRETAGASTTPSAIDSLRDADVGNTIAALSLENATGTTAGLNPPGQAGG
eukprot:5888549-Amphidinium_carterae.1